MIAVQTALPSLPFPVFLDVDAAVLAAEDTPCRSPRDVLASAWTDYLRRVLPPQENDRPGYSAACA